MSSSPTTPRGRPRNSVKKKQKRYNALKNLGIVTPTKPSIFNESDSENDSDSFESNRDVNWFDVVTENLRDAIAACKAWKNEHTCLRTRYNVCNLVSLQAAVSLIHDVYL